MHFLPHISCDKHIITKLLQAFERRSQSRWSGFRPLVKWQSDC